MSKKYDDKGKATLVMADESKSEAPTQEKSQQAELQTATLTGTTTQSQSTPYTEADPNQPLQTARQVEVRQVQAAKMMKVKIRQSVVRMRYGGEWLQFIKDQEVLVPEPLATHLAEKGII
jgi:putative N-acetylmannosamine-6-phosphate epimerase